MRFLEGWVLAALLGASLLAGEGLAQEYGEGGEGGEGGEDAFSAAVDPARFRKGNPEWDTQELVANGMKALHQEHLQILRELREVKARLSRLEGKR